MAGKGKERLTVSGRHELIADGLVQYLKTGVAPTPELQGVFELFKEWLKSVYDSILNHATSFIKRNPDNWFVMPDEVRDAYAKIFGGSYEPLDELGTSMTPTPELSMWADFDEDELDTMMSALDMGMVSDEMRMRTLTVDDIDEMQPTPVPDIQTGRPATVALYRGTRSAGGNPRASKFGPGTYYSSNPRVAASYGDSIEEASEFVEGSPEIAGLEEQMRLAAENKDWETYYDLKDRVPEMKVRAMAAILSNPDALASFVAGTEVTPLSPQEALVKAEEILTDTSYRSAWEQRLYEFSQKERASRGGGGSDYVDGKTWTDDEGKTHSADGNQIGAWWEEYNSFSTTAEKAQYLRDNEDFAAYYYNYVKEKYGETEKWWETYGNDYTRRTPRTYGGFSNAGGGGGYGGGSGYGSAGGGYAGGGGR